MTVIWFTCLLVCTLMRLLEVTSPSMSLVSQTLTCWSSLEPVKNSCESSVTASVLTAFLCSNSVVISRP